MGLKELAEEALLEKGDFEWHKLGNRPGFFNGISVTEDTERIKAEYFVLGDKVRYSLKIDGQEIPFATVQRIAKRILPDTYEARVEILPSMIPQAMEAMATYLQNHPVITDEIGDFSRTDAIPFVRRVQAVQKELNSLLESALLERKTEEQSHTDVRHLIESVLSAAHRAQMRASYDRAPRYPS